ncbi:MAG: GyrI-like domain-containing protein [Anaerolineales bacterium]|nr:GyrI-like domain-containing protein [Anaerolineales bacterium]
MAASSIFERFFAHDITSIEPRIVDLEQPIQILGMAVDTNPKTVYRDIPALGKRFANFKKMQEIPNKRLPWGFAAVSKGFDEEKGTFTYFMGDRVTTLEQIPDGLKAFEIPAAKYAVFPIRPKNRFGWPVAIASAKRHIYTAWLPNSNYTPAGMIDDFEYHDERSLRKSNPEIDLYVSIKER